MVPELLGWYGVASLLVAYALLNFDVLSPHSLSYLLLNITGSVGILVDALSQRNWQPAVLNVVWGLIAVASLVRVMMR